MNRNEKINIIVTATVVLGSTALFAISARRATRKMNKLNAKVDTLTA